MSSDIKPRQGLRVIKPSAEVARLFSRASAQIMCNNKTGLYSALLMQVPIRFTKDIRTAAVDSYSKMYINPDFIEKKSIDEVIFLLIHELEHLLGLHAQRLNDRNHKRWNVATDSVINQHLINDRIGSFIEGGVNMPEALGKTADHMYNHLPENYEDQFGDGGATGGTGEDIIFGDGEKGDDGRSMTPADMRDCEQQARTIISNAAQAARVAGTLSEEMQRRIEDVLDITTPWYEILERFMMDRAETDYTWAKPNRRFIGGGLHLPSLDSIAALGPVVFIRDVSGSISYEEHSAYIGHVNAIAERCAPSEVHVLDVSTVVHHQHKFTREELPMNPEVMGGGGTDMCAGFDFINEKLDEVAVCVVLTDGYTPWPDRAQDYPVVVVCTTDTHVDYGDEVIRCEDLLK